MAWIRKVRTDSGATAVQIAESVSGRHRIVCHVGSARDEAELGLLIEEANRLLIDDQQGFLDLGITPTAVAKVAMVSRSTATGLFPDPPSAAVQVVPRARVLKTSSTLLYDALPGCTPTSGSTSSATRSSATS